MTIRIYAKCLDFIWMPRRATGWPRSVQISYESETTGTDVNRLPIAHHTYIPYTLPGADQKGVRSLVRVLP